MKKVRLIIVFYFVQGIIHNLGHPVTPWLVRSQGIPDFMFGVFFATMSFGLMVGGPIWGTIGDKGKKKRYIVIGLLMYSIGQFFFGFAHNQYWMIFFRFFSGFGVVSTVALYASYIIELTPLKDRARYLAYGVAATTLGTSIGYFVGGFLGTNPFFVQLLHVTDYSQIFTVQSIVNVIYAMVVLVLLKDIEEEPDIEEYKPSFFKSLKSVGKMRLSLLLFLISLAFIFMGVTNLDKYKDVYFNNLHFTPETLGLFVMVSGFVSLFASVVIVPIFAKFKKQLVAMIIIQVVSAAIIVYVFRATNFLLTIYTVFMVYVILRAVHQPLEQNYISLHAKKGEYGKIMGVRQSFVSLGMIIGPLAGGFVFQKNPLLLFDSSAMTFLIAAVLLVLVIIIEKRNRHILSEDLK